MNHRDMETTEKSRRKYPILVCLLLLSVSSVSLWFNIPVLLR